MGLLGSVARAILLDRLMRGGRRRGGYGRSGYGAPSPYGPSPYSQPYGGRPGGRFRLLPFPHYSRRTRSGARVSVGGCCLPIPLMVVATSGLAGVVSVRRLTRGRSGV
jgi:hypothetical protein